MEEILKAENIAKTYSTGSIEVQALKKCSLSVHRGEYVAVIGRSGSGKSTLLRILASFDRPDEGSVTIDGQDILSLKGKKLAALRREKIGFIYQNYCLFPEYTAYENVVLPLLIDKKTVVKDEAEQLMESLGIADCKGKYPGEMSGGQQQRTAIARALITHPAVIFADEPTGNLDAANADSVARILSQASMRYGQTIVMVTHDKQMADYADRIVPIVDGCCG